MLKSYKGSIRKELLRGILSAVMIATLVGYAIFIEAYMENERKRDVSLAQTISQIIGQDVARIIYADNISVASDVTTQLDSFPNLYEVVLYKTDGKALFQYSKDNETHKDDIFKKNMLSNITIKDGKLQFYSKLFYKETFLVDAKFVFKTKSIEDIFLDSLSFLLLILAVMLFLAYILSRYQANKFSSPILSLVNFLENIKDESFLRNRVKTKKENEFGILYDEINIMLQRMEDSLSHDNLTGLHNRNSLTQDISLLKNSAIIMIVDIRAFKEINDIYGNSFGNKVLIEFTKHLHQFFANFDEPTMYRIGGDEFAVLFRNKIVAEVMQIGKNLEETIRDENFKIDNIRTNLSVNIAINSVAPLLENADLALKAIKKEMYRHIIEYKEELSVKKEWQKNIKVVNMVKSAIAEDRIVPYFQGIVNLKTMKIEKYEALVRLILPSGEVLSPYAFLDIVSKTNYYYDITKIMIRKTIEVAKSHPTQRFSINFSMKDIINENIIHTLFELFDTDKETAKRVDIELLETELVVVDDNRINDFIAKVHSYGSKVLIDDFGTGYSNFSYLSELDVDILKIDASITKEITTNPRKLHILRTIHNFTSGMNMLNVAEFVETKEIALLLQKTGVEYAQGYLFSKPLPQPLKNSDVSIG